MKNFKMKDIKLEVKLKLRRAGELANELLSGSI